MPPRSGLGQADRTRGGSNRSSEQPDLVLGASYFVFDGLVAVSTRAEPDVGGNAGSAHLVNDFVAALDGAKHGIPFPFNVGAVGVQASRQARFG